MATEVSRSAMAPSSWSVRPWFFCRAFILPQEVEKHYAEIPSPLLLVLTFAPLSSAAFAFSCSLPLTGNLMHPRKRSLCFAVKSTEDSSLDCSLAFLEWKSPRLLLSFFIHRGASEAGPVPDLICERRNCKNVSWDLCKTPPFLLLLSPSLFPIGS